MFQRYLLLLLLLLFQLHEGVVGVPSTSASDTPIKLWEPSWVASSVRGTCVAVSCRLGLGGTSDCDDCVLLLTRSPAPSAVTSKLQWKPSPPPSAWQEMSLADGDSTLRILPVDTDLSSACTTDRAAVPWTRIGKRALCTMTGLASDVDHATRVLQNQIHVHGTIYDDFPMPVSGIAKWLAETVRNAAKWNGGRPYGLQALLVGRQDNNNSPFFVYSVDPSGGWRHWGSGCSAIGRNAEDVRQHLYEALQKTLKEDKDKKLNPLQALKVAFQAVLKATQEASFNQDNDQYEAAIFWVDPADSNRQCRMATLDPQAVYSCKDAVWEAL